MPAANFIPTLLYMLGGLIIWGVRFLAAYSFTGIACARGWADREAENLVPLTIGVASLLALVACSALVAHAMLRLRVHSAPAGGENVRFVHGIAAFVGAFAIVAIVWETLPVLIVPICT
jgi:hypothetical protein